jgi:hypothetical protein
VWHRAGPRSEVAAASLFKTVLAIVPQEQRQFCCVLQWEKALRHHVRRNERMYISYSPAEESGSSLNIYRRNSGIWEDKAHTETCNYVIS